LKEHFTYNIQNIAVLTSCIVVIKEKDRNAYGGGGSRIPTATKTINSCFSNSGHSPAELKGIK
jgi:hypothetical protein